MAAVETSKKLAEKPSDEVTNKPAAALALDFESMPGENLGTVDSDAAYAGTFDDDREDWRRSDPVVFVGSNRICERGWTRRRRICAGP